MGIHYDLYKVRTSTEKQEEWLTECYYTIISLDITKSFTTKLKKGFFISKRMDSYGIIRANQQVRTKGKKQIVESTDFISIGICIKATASEGKTLAHLINTFSHEIAHQAHWDHSKEHAKMTNMIAKLIKEELTAIKVEKKIMEIRKKLSNISK